ncbi:MAG: hypothetical protein ACJ754_18480 [Pyrinomonadaceae bacterium]
MVVIAAALLTLTWAVAPAFAQRRDEFATGQKQAAAKNPPGVSFVLRLKGGQTRFRQGEVIRLELSFASSLPGTYHLDSATYDRSGRLEVDDFHLDPEGGTSDPLYDYFHFRGGFLGGGLRGNPALEAKPYVVGAELNEWYRFERHGRYRLYVTSGRVGRGGLGGEGGPLTATSNVIEFEVVPAEAAWAKQTLAQAAAVLDSRERGADRRAACRTLRFLGTEDAVRELVRRFDGRDADSGCESEYDFGLRSTPHRALAVAEMERRLVAPEHPVTASFIYVLSFLSFLQQNIAPLAPYPEQGDEEAIKLWRKEYDRRWSLYGETVDGYAARLAASVFAKEGAVRAVSLETLVSLRSASPRRKETPEEAKAAAALTGALVSIFADLPANTQERLLEFEWPQVAGPEMLPALRRIYQSPAQGNDLLPGAALRRLYELSPDEGRRLIIEEMRRPTPRVRMQVLGMLPDESLAEVDALVAERLGAGTGAFDDDSLLRLAERYATAAVSPQLRAAYEGKIGRMACAPQSALLAYMLRVEPGYGAGLVEKALTSRKDTGCYKSLLTDVAGLHMSRELERVAAASLDDPDAELAANAAGMLGGYGSAEVRDALLRRFERWHGDWAGREKELNAQNESDPPVAQARVEEALLHALTSSHAWLADGEMLDKLRLLCVTKNCLREAESARGQFGTAITVFFNVLDGSVSSATLAQYNSISWESLKAKAAQFPKGTTFTWSSDSPGTEAEGRAFGELKEHLEKAGLKLIRR